ncbi:hypothetical protein MKS88_001734 [Plasmodium brasilianum]|uniref:Uncharacterized protein n=1 Tax=Plasmodium brasilianum TaxID=5824 RepID=A0ACB9YF24_PLABR|nr:hypothetical protein MKS88_001734 [Plasmodium brasilianum]
MEQKIMLSLFIKISTIILLTWLYHSYYDVNSLKENMDEKYNFSRHLKTSNCRLLAKYKQEKDSRIANFKEEMPHKELKEKKYISNNKKETEGKLKQSCRSSLYIEKYSKNVKKNKCGIGKTKKYFDFEKKIFKKLDYEYYVKNIKIIEYNEYKKLARRKRRIRITLLLLFILILILPILDLSLETFTEGGLLGLLRMLYKTGSKETGIYGVEGLLTSLLSEGTWGNIEKICVLSLFFYGVPFLIFVVIFILGMIYYYKKVIKYENIKFRKRLNE